MDKSILESFALKALGTRKHVPPVWQFYDAELHEFAEMIVRECAEVAGCNGHVSGFSLGDLIKEHFGVEE